MEAINLISGYQIIPGLINIDELLNGLEVKAKPIDTSSTLDLVDRAALLNNSDLKSIGAGRIVRKTSDRQSRWIIDSAVSTWINAKLSFDPKRVGLFLGIGTVDCEDDDKPHETNSSYTDYANASLTKTKPLAVLTVLNSTVASHISNLLNITGTNAVFSPFADAGAQAFIEAFYNIRENRCKHSLIVGGSQKITPWYFASYQDYFKQGRECKVFPTESASSLIATNEPYGANGKLLAAKRSYVHNTDRSYPGLDELYMDLLAQGYSAPKQIIHCGNFDLSSTTAYQLSRYFSSANHCNLDKLIGYTGPAGAMHSVNLALIMLERKLGINNIGQTKEIQKLTSDTVLVVAYGHHGQICYLLIGNNYE